MLKWLHPQAPSPKDSLLDSPCHQLKPMLRVASSLCSGPTGNTTPPGSVATLRPPPTGNIGISSVLTQLLLVAPLTTAPCVMIAMCTPSIMMRPCAARWKYLNRASAPRSGPGWCTSYVGSVSVVSPLNIPTTPAPASPVFQLQGWSLRARCRLGDQVETD